MSILIWRIKCRSTRCSTETGPINIVHLADPAKGFLDE